MNMQALAGYVALMSRDGPLQVLQQLGSNRLHLGLLVLSFNEEDIRDEALLWWKVATK
jgi:hypothetical protein